jgi:cbb3-type cytochrome oxidase subunit 3
MLSGLVPLAAIFGFLIAKILFALRQHLGRDLAKKTKLAIELIISLGVLALGLVVVIYDPQNKHWAYAAIGVAFGYWLDK